MPDKRQHRGPHPDDHRQFAADAHPALRQAVSDLSWLLTRGYAERSALKLVGDRFNLSERQRIAVMRCACGDHARKQRIATEVSIAEVAGNPIYIDGYNILTTIEAALGGGVVLRARDACLRDMASMHGSYRKVAETHPALIMIGEILQELGTAPCHWYLDQPVSNSGRLKVLMAEMAEDNEWNWRIELVPDPDQVLIDTKGIIVTADSMILDRVERWFNLASCVLERRLPNAPIVDLS